MRDYPLTHIHPNASIANGVEVAPFAVIEEDVVIGEGTQIGPHAMILNGTRIGHHCKIHAGAIVGNYPQDLKFVGEDSLCQIDDHVTVREYCTINRGTAASGTTRIKSHALIMAYAHIAHDCLIEEYAIISNGSQLAGHVMVGRYAIVGGMTAVHQFVRIGDHSFVGGGTLVRKDVPPYIKAAREPLCYVGVNSIGLSRRGFDTALIKHIQDIYRILFIQHSNISFAVKELERSINASVQKQEILEFIVGSERGILKGFRQLNGPAF